MDARVLKNLLDYLVDDIAYNTTTATIAQSNARSSLSVTNYDAMLVAYPRRYVPYFLPYVTLVESESQWNSQAALFCVMKSCFKSLVIYVPKLIIRKSVHRNYT